MQRLLDSESSSQNARLLRACRARHAKTQRASPARLLAHGEGRARQAAHRGSLTGRESGDIEQRAIEGDHARHGLHLAGRHQK